MSWTTKPLSRVRNVSKHARLFLSHIVIKISNRSRGQQSAGMHTVLPEPIVTIPSRHENKTKTFKGSGSPRRKAPARSLLPSYPKNFIEKTLKTNACTMGTSTPSVAWQLLSKRLENTYVCPDVSRSDTIVATLGPYIHRRSTSRAQAWCRWIFHLPAQHARG